MSGNVLNKKGMFNRCKLTRMVINTEWDQKEWEEAWEPRAEEVVTEDSLRETGRGSKEGGAAKRAKGEEQGVIWGEEPILEDRAKREFLLGQSVAPNTNKAKATLKVYSGVEWVTRELIKECTHKAVELASVKERAATWGEWESRYVGEPSLSIPTKEEKHLWWILTELDKEDAKKGKKQKLKEKLKKAKKVTMARKKIGADKCQPSILDRMKNSLQAKFTPQPQATPRGGTEDL